MICTIKALQQKINEKFDMANATENKIILCMRKLCLNTRLLFNVVKKTGEQ